MFSQHLYCRFDRSQMLMPPVVRALNMCHFMMSLSNISFNDRMVKRKKEKKKLKTSGSVVVEDQGQIKVIVYQSLWFKGQASGSKMLCVCHWCRRKARCRSSSCWSEHFHQVLQNPLNFGWSGAGNCSRVQVKPPDKTVKSQQWKLFLYHTFCYTHRREPFKTLPTRKVWAPAECLSQVAWAFNSANYFCGFPF